MIEIPESQVIQEVTYNQMPRGRLVPLGEHGYWLEPPFYGTPIPPGTRGGGGELLYVKRVQSRRRIIGWWVAGVVGVVVWMFAVIGFYTVVIK